MTELEFPKSSDQERTEVVGRQGRSRQFGQPAQSEGMPDGETIRHAQPVEPVPGERWGGWADTTRKVDIGSSCPEEPVAKSPTVEECAALRAEVRCLREIVSGLEDERDFLRHLLGRDLSERRRQEHELAPEARRVADDRTRSIAPDDGGYCHRDTPSVDFMGSADAGFPQGPSMRRGSRILPLAVTVALIILLSFLLLDKLLLLSSVLADG